MEGPFIFTNIVYFAKDPRSQSRVWHMAYFGFQTAG